MSPDPMLPPGVRLREAGEADLDELTDVWEAGARSTHGFMADDDFDDARPYLRDQLMPSMQLWAAESGDALVGFIGVRDDHVQLLYLDPDWHGMGIGTALLAHVGRPTSVEVYAGNTHGLGFYESRGFRRVRTHTHDAFGRPFPVIHLLRDPAG